MTLAVRAPLVIQGTRAGDSIAVNGVCLTVTEILGDTFKADVIAETLARTTLASTRPGAAVNLERAVRADGRLGGHIVQGHVDGVGRLMTRRHSESWDDLTFLVPGELAKYIAVKGSIAINGVSLTVTEVSDTGFGVSLIPTTLRMTNLGQLHPEEGVNIEVDVIAKYVDRLVKAYDAEGFSL
jgi:riboflavin synthase